MFQRMRGARVRDRRAEEPVDAVHDVDLGKLLDSLGLSEALEQGSVRCEFCDHVVTSDTVGALYPRGEAVRVVCDRPHCMARLVTDLNQRDGGGGSGESGR